MVPLMAAMNRLAVLAWSGRVKHNGFSLNVGGFCVTSLTRTRRHVLGLFLHPTAGLVNVKIGSGTYS